jgi:cytochrome bd-type quinol oxidase subunit 1
MYPLWVTPWVTPGIVLAVIATFHMLPSHLSTSAMWFNIYMERKAYRENRPELLDFVRKYSLFLLIFSYVLGSLSGVGIWYAATVANPRGISGLIHNYVWGWATEWVFFIVEVLGIFIYYYTFGKVDRKTHLKIGWIFAVGSWTTMIVITGILAFMVSPGKWPVTGSFFDGFFNETYWPQLLMRTTLMFAIAAAYAIAVATRLQNEEVRKTVIKAASRWGVAGTVLGTVLSFWYLRTLPSAAAELGASFIPITFKAAIVLSAGLVALYFLFAALKPQTIKLVPALIAILVVFGGIISAETVRETVRKPYIIPQYMYSNQIIGKDIPSKSVKSEVPMINEKGILKTAPFVPARLRDAKDSGTVKDAGEMIALIECSACHAFFDGGTRPIIQMVRRLELKDIESAEALLDGLDGYPHMPPFAGTESEKKALAAYLVSLNK